MKTIRKLCENKISFYLFSMIIPMILMGGICLLMHIVPFGDHTFLIADMQKQYVDFFAYYREILHGNHGIFYTFGKCLGGDMYGFYTYYLASPLNLFFLFISNAAIPGAVTILILIKLGLCGLTMSIYLRNHFESCLQTGSLPCLWIFSTGYAMMSFLMVNSFNLMWHEPIILFPLIILGLESLILEGKCKLYVLSLSASLFCNYYISYMICIFCVLYFIGMTALHWEKNTLFRRLVRFTCSSLLSAGLCAVFLLPTFFTISGSLKDEGAVAIGITHFNVSPLHVLSKLLTFSFSANELMNGMPNLFCGLLVVILVTVYFFHGKISLREKLVYLGLLTCLLISFCSAKLDYAWHAFMEPSGYPYRYAFIFSFLLLVLGCEGLFALIKHGITAKTMIPSCLSFLVLFVPVMRQKYEYINKQLEWLDLAFFLIVWICLFLLFHAPKTSIAKGSSDKNENFNEKEISNRWSLVRRILFLLLALLQLSNLTLSNLFIYRSLRNTSYSTISEYENLYEPISEAIVQLRSQDDSFYRMENLNRSSLNNSMHYGYAGLSHYSSNEQFFVLRFLQKMGLNYNHLYLEYGQGATATLDSLLGVKYLIADESTINKPYEKVIVPDSANVFSVYRNPYALPIAFMADEGIKDISSETHYNDPFELQEKIYRSLSGSNSSACHLFENAVLSVEEVSNGKKYKLCAATDGYLYMYGDANGILKNGALYKNGELVSDYYDLHRWCIINLGYFKKGETCDLVLTSDMPKEMGQAYFVSENTDALQELHGAIDISDVSLQKLSDSHLKMKANGDQHPMLLLTIPYEKNWKIKVDGEKINAVKVFDTLTAIPISSGDHIVEMNYIPKGFWLGLWISIFCLIIFVMVFLSQFHPVMRHFKPILTFRLNFRHMRR